MEILQAILLGIIEGLTEFLPISSTGHLVIAEEYIHFKDEAKIFTVAIQIGAVAAVIWHYRRNLASKFSGLFKNDRVANRFFTNVFIATVPAALLGLALDKSFEKYANPKVVAVALIAGALVLWWADKRVPASRPDSREDIDSITPRQALVTGLAQCLALIPGVSRSGAVIVGGLLGGLNRVTATGFSFYLAIPILLLAGAYKLVTGRGELSSVDGGGLSILVGTAVSFVVALAAISWLLRYVSTHSFKIFVYYRLLLGVLILLILAW